MLNHLRLNLQTFLPGFAVIEEASHHDSSRMIALCAGLQEGEIAIFDKASVHFKHLFSLTQGSVDWLTRAKVCDLYQSRWAIEVFFKQIKQTLQICDFPGHSKQAIRWQLWSALLLYVLLRFQAWMSDWPHSFTRLFTMVRSVIWDRFALSDTLQFYGTAGGQWRMCSQPEQAYLPGFAP